jgi:phosphoglycolate phosphatase-like HAD superfamily hydrolase
VDPRRYSTLLFDCDGVILDSNRLKTSAFFTAALPYGIRAAEALVEYHRANGGISRYHKFTYFLQEIARVPVEQASVNCLLEAYANGVRDGLLSCDIDSSLEALRAATAHARWMVVSGGDQDELRDIFDLRQLTPHFKSGIFGSPDSKETILARERMNGTIQMPALFIGDSRYDHEAALHAGLDFVFVHHWSEFEDWRSYQLMCGFPTVTDLGELLELISQTGERE